MREREEPASQYAWILYAVATIVFGGIAGYVISVQSAQRAAVTAPAAAADAADAHVVNESQLQAYREILARDPKNVQAAVHAGNLLYDARRYQEAIGFYTQAFALNPSDVNVSTDLGTALWYTGRADEALAQYARSLAVNPGHAQTLFNVGIVRSEGKRDYRGAIAAWETLLETSPGYADSDRVRLLIAEARAKS